MSKHVLVNIDMQYSSMENLEDLGYEYGETFETAKDFEDFMRAEAEDQGRGIIEQLRVDDWIVKPDTAYFSVVDVAQTLTVDIP